MSVLNYGVAAIGIALTPFTGGASLTMTAGALGKEKADNDQMAKQAAATNQKSTEEAKKSFAAAESQAKSEDVAQDVDQARLNS